MSGLKRILTIGLAQAPASADAAHKKMIGSPEGHNMRLQTMKKQGKEAGFDLTLVAAKPGDFPTYLREVQELLKSQSWDGIMIGFGVRGTVEYSQFFQDLVNASRELRPEVKMAFNTSPQDIVECAQRSFS